MTLEFINNNANIDRIARKRIRSHVALGRNAGRTLARPSRGKLSLEAENTKTHFRIPKVIEDTRRSARNEVVLHRIERQIGDGLSVLCLPRQLRTGTTHLLQRVFTFINDSQYNPELNVVRDAAGSHTSMWVRFMFMDEAYFHCVVAMTLTILNNVMDQEDFREAIRHQSQTLRLLNERLSRDDAVSDATIAAVVAMAQYARLQGQSRQGLVHLEGLQRMIELRGGVSELSKNKPDLTQMILKTDLEYALHQGSATRFYVRDIIASSTAMSTLSSGLRRVTDDQKLSIFNSRLLRQLSPDLRTLLVDTTDLAWLINNTSAKYRQRLDGFSFHDYLALLGYRLVNTYPLGESRPVSRIENVVHLGLIAFIITFLRGFDRQIPDFPILSKLVRSAAQSHLDDEQMNQEVLLWILFIGEASIFTPFNDEAWLLPKTAQAMQDLDLYTWEDVVQTLVKFPWINAVHDKTGKALCHRSTSQYRQASF